MGGRYWPNGTNRLAVPVTDDPAVMCAEKALRISGGVADRTRWEQGARFRARLVQLRPPAAYGPAQRVLTAGGNLLTIAPFGASPREDFMTCTEISILITAFAQLIAAVAQLKMSMRRQW